MSLYDFQKYLALEKKYSDHTVRAYEKDLQTFGQFCKEEFEIEDLISIHHSMVRSWIVSLSEAGITHRTINRKISALKAYYKYLLKKGVIEVSPLAQQKSLKVSRKVEVPFSVAEMEKLLSEIEFEEGFEGERNKLLIDLLYTTGIRRSELIGIQLKDLDLRRGTLKVLGKRNKERILPLLPAVIPQIHSYLDQREVLFSGLENPYLFVTPTGNKLYETLVYRIINRYLSMVSSKVKKSPHILRHTFATHLLNKGADMNAVKELLGHASLASTQVYTHNSIAELKKVHASAHPRNRKK